MKSFKQKKLEKKQREVEENLKYELAYNNLSEDEKFRFDVLAKERKFYNHANRGLMALTLAAIIYNGYEVLDGQFYDFDLPFIRNLGSVLGISFESFFMNPAETLIRLASVVGPYALSYHVNTLDGIAQAEQNTLLKMPTKSGIIDRLFTRHAERKKNIETNKQKEKVGDFIVNPYNIDTPEHVVLSQMVNENKNEAKEEFSLFD